MVRDAECSGTPDDDDDAYIPDDYDEDYEDGFELANFNADLNPIMTAYRDDTFTDYDKFYIKPGETVFVQITDNLVKMVDVEECHLVVTRSDMMFYKEYALFNDDE